MYILFDIGGTKTRVSYSEDGKTCAEPLVIETPSDFDEGVTALAQTAQQVASGRVIEAAAGGAPGPLDRGKTKLVNSPNLGGWVDHPLKERLAEMLGVPVFIENDTAIVGLGEAVHGAGKGYDIVAYITVSTGVGGVRIVKGRIDLSRFGFEVGHQVIDLDNSACSNCTPCPVCGSVVDLESMVSGSATERRFNKKPYDISPEDPLWSELAAWLAYGLNNTIVHWSPDVVVIGGSMVVKKPGIEVDEVRKKLGEVLTIFPEHPEIKEADLEDFGGLYGALAYVTYQTQSSWAA